MEGEQGEDGRGEERVEELKQQDANRSRLFRGKMKTATERPASANVLIKRASSEADNLVLKARRVE